MNAPDFTTMTPAALLAWWEANVGLPRASVTAEECDIAAAALEFDADKEFGLKESGRLIGCRESRTGTEAVDIYAWRVTIGPGLDEELMAEYMEGLDIDAEYPADPWGQCCFTGQREDLTTFRARVAGIV